MKEEKCGDAHEDHAVLRLSGWLLPASPRAQPHVADVLGADCDLQREPARSNPQQSHSMHSEVVHALPNHGHAHSHVSNNHLRMLQVSKRARGPLRDGAEEQSGVSAQQQSTLPHPACMHPQGEPHQDPYPDLDSPGAGAQYVRREVLELVKLKAKTDLAQLETELMAVIQAMEAQHRGAAAGGNVSSHLLTPDLTPALRPQSADNSPSPGAVSEMTSPTTRTKSPPARRKGLNTERRQRASGTVTLGGAAGRREGSAHSSPVSLPDTGRAGGQEAPRSTNLEATSIADDAHEGHLVIFVCHQLLLHSQASVLCAPLSAARCT